FQQLVKPLSIYRPLDAGLKASSTQPPGFSAACLAPENRPPTSSEFPHQRSSGLSPAEKLSAATAGGGEPMKLPLPPRLQVSHEELQDQLEHTRTALSEQPCQQLKAAGTDRVRRITTYPVRLTGPLEGKQIHVGLALHRCLTCGYLMPTPAGPVKVDRKVAMGIRRFRGQLPGSAALAPRALTGYALGRSSTGIQPLRFWRT